MKAGHSFKTTEHGDRTRLQGAPYIRVVLISGATEMGRPMHVRCRKLTDQRPSESVRCLGSKSCKLANVVPPTFVQHSLRLLKSRCKAPVDTTLDMV